MVRTLHGLMAAIGGRAPALLVAGIAVGLAWPALAALMRPYLLEVVIGLLTVSLLRLGGVPRPTVLTVALTVWLLAVSPLAVWGLARALELPGGVTLALVLMAATAPITSSPALALVLGLDAVTALGAMVLATVVLPVSLPLLVQNTMGLPLSIDSAGLAVRLSGVIGGAAAMSWAVRRVAGADAVERGRGLLDGMSVVLLVVFALGAMDGVARRFLDDPAHVGFVLGAAVAASLILQGAGAVAFMAAGRRRALTAGYVSGNRNMAVLLAVLPLGVHPDVPLFIALVQIPVYLMPALSRPVYRWFLAGRRGPS